MIVAMATTARPQQRYDHRLRHLVQTRAGKFTMSVEIAPRWTAVS